MEDGTASAQNIDAQITTAERLVAANNQIIALLGQEVIARSKLVNLSAEEAALAQKRQGLKEQITALELGIQSIYQDDGGEGGLYTLMRKAVQLVLQRAEIEKSWNPSTAKALCSCAARAS